MTTTTDDLLRVEEVAAMFGVKPSAIYAGRSRGQKPGALAIKINKRLWWRRSDLIAWLDSEATRQHAERG